MISVQLVLLYLILFQVLHRGKLLSSYKHMVLIFFFYRLILFSCFIRIYTSLFSFSFLGKIRLDEELETFFIVVYYVFKLSSAQLLAGGKYSVLILEWDLHHVTTFSKNTVSLVLVLDLFTTSDYNKLESSCYLTI